MPAARIAEISVYPVKSAAGLRLDACPLETRGLAGDRRWMVVSPEGRFFTWREHPRLVLVRARLGDEALLLDAPGRPPLAVPRAGTAAAGRRARAAVTVHGDDLHGVDAGDEAARWLSDLFRDPGPARGDDRRLPSPRPSRRRAAGRPRELRGRLPGARHRARSLDELNARLAEPATMRRFRPQPRGRGRRPFAEDHWWRLRIGEVELEGAENCERCMFPTIDPDTGEKDARREPMRTLATFRRRPDGGVFLGQHFVPRTLGTVRVGDEVEVLT